MCEGAIHFLLIVLVLRHLTCHTLFQMERRQLSPKYLPALSTKTACCCLPRREAACLEKFRDLVLALINQAQLTLLPSLLPHLPKTTIKELQDVRWYHPAEMGLATPKSFPQPLGQPQNFVCTDWKDGKGLSTFHLSWIFIHVPVLILQDCHSLVNIHIVDFKISLKPSLPQWLLKTSGCCHHILSCGVELWIHFFLLYCSHTLS